MRPRDPEGEEKEKNEQDEPSILSLPVARRFDMPLILVLPSIDENYQKVYLLATAASQNEENDGDSFKKGPRARFFFYCIQNQINAWGKRESRHEGRH